MHEASETIFVECETEHIRVNLKQLESIASKIVTLLSLEKYQVNIRLTDDDEIRALNRSYRGKDKTTDVLSFPQLNWHKPVELDSPSAQPLAIHLQTKDELESELLGAWALANPSDHLGDIIISVPEATKNAENIGHGVDRELCFLLVHGILHLCGHDHIHPEEEQVMLKNQNAIMLALSPPNSPNWLGCIQDGN